MVGDMEYGEGYQASHVQCWYQTASNTITQIKNRSDIRIVPTFQEAKSSLLLLF